MGTVLVTCAYDPDGVLKEYAAEAAEQSRRIAGRTQPFSASAPGTFRSTARQAELDAAKFLRVLGLRDAYATSATSDAGIDVLGTRVAAQVKWQKSQVGRPAIQSFLGACHPDISNRILCFFAYSGFTAPATNLADSVPMALFRFDGSPTQWSPANLVAREFVEVALKNR
ncbi:restriction endonuclease [Dietzia sp. Die43]|uniref:restriction endonuclease n=1 Tax=Dietzia sp. Die43 TaxID=2926011 RepID=UPI00211767E3|nr:restriction endonuclease [Dietzia sp. Die43]